MSGNEFNPKPNDWMTTAFILFVGVTLFIGIIVYLTGYQPN